MTELRGKYLAGAEQISAFLCAELQTDWWTLRRVRAARSNGTLPIRKQPGTAAIYAFGDELLSALRAADTLPAKVA